MILYKSDWGTQRATVHTNTQNTTFIKMHHILKDMGITNNAFFLAIHNEKLMDVDPFDYSKITPEISQWIAIECKINPWYFFREIVRLPATGTDPIRLMLNRANLFLFWAFFNSVNVFLTQPRQTGKTINSEVLMVLLHYFIYKNTRIKLFTHSNKLILENISKFKTIRDELPEYLFTIDKKRDIENKEEVHYAALNNYYVTTTAQKDPAGALNAGRGGTVLVNQLDEMPFCANIEISYPVLMNAKNAAVASARSAGLPFADVITTTAARMDTDSGKYVYNILTKCCVFNEYFYDLDNNPTLKNVIAQNSKNNMIYGEFSYRQLEYTKAWADEVAKQNNLSPDDVERDLNNKWTIGTAMPAVRADLLQKLEDFKCSPVYMEEIDGYIFRWYEEPSGVWKKDRHFVMALDTSENIDRDFTTVHMLDISDLSTVMTSRCNDADLIKLADHIADMLIKHPNITLIPERKSTAIVLISIICAKLWDHGINPFSRIYNKIFQNRDISPFNKLDTNTRSASEGPSKKYFGYVTAGSGENSRDNLYKLTLNRSLTICYQVVRDLNLIQELKSLTTKNGRIDHTTGGHDDSVIAFMLAAWFVIHGKNHYLYGIPDHLKLTKITKDGELIDVNKVNRQRTLRSRINNLNQQIEGTQSSIVKQGLIRERQFLLSELESLGTEIETVTAIGDAEKSKTKYFSADEVVSVLDKDFREYRKTKLYTDPY